MSAARASQHLNTWQQPHVVRFRRPSTPVVLFGVLVLAALFVPLLNGVDPQAVSLLETNAPPSAAHWFGTDSLGRDVFVRTAAGGRLSLGVALGAMMIATVLGAALGGTAALGKAWTDRLIGRGVDLLLALPSIPLLIVLQSIAPRGVVTLVAVLGISRCGEIARLSRAQCQSTLREDFVLAATAGGATRLHVFRRHTLPPEDPSWGTMLSSAQDNILGGAWWAVVFPGLAIAVAVFSVNAIADSLRDRFLHV